MRESHPTPPSMNSTNRNSPTNTLNNKNIVYSRKLQLPPNKFHNDIVKVKALTINKRSSNPSANV